MAKKVSLVQLRKDLLKEQKRLNDRLAAIDTALKGIAAVIDLNLADASETANGRDESLVAGPTLKDRIVDEARRQPGQFTAPQLFEDLQKRLSDRNLNKSTVSHALREAAERGILRAVTPGAGKRPTVYQTTQLNVTPPAMQFQKGRMNEFEEEEETGAETSEEVPAP